MEHFYLAHLWTLLLTLMLALYVILDGFDLGIGILSLFTPAQRGRAVMMKSISAIWDANETWLVLAGGTLFGAFPVVYAVVLNALYVPIMLMLFGFIFRAVSFEFRGQSRQKRLWEFCFGLGSLLAAAGQGFVLGGLMTEIKTGPTGFVGGALDWFNLLSVLVTIAVVFGYVMIGASYLIAKTQGDLRDSIHRCMTISSILMFVMITAITIMMPFTYQEFADKWVSRHTRYIMYALAMGAVFAFIMLLMSTVFRKYSRLPFIMSLVIFVVAFAGLGVGLYPYLVPPSITIESAASSSKTLISMIYGIGLLIPVMLFYNLYMYRVFHGVVEETKDEY
jgi:cytochrome d ubiquinol oxidase subunit II